MPDYQKGKIYKLWSPSKNLVYYGSTTQTLCQRLAEHKYKKSRQCTSSLILDCDDYKIELVEDYPCNNKQQLMKKESEYIRNNKCVNVRIEDRTDEEYAKEHKEQTSKTNKIYYKNNKEQKSKTSKIYYEKNKDKINKQNNQRRKNNKEKTYLRQKRYRETKKQNNAIYKWLLWIGIIP